MEWLVPEGGVEEPLFELENPLPAPVAAVVAVAVEQPPRLLLRDYLEIAESATLPWLLEMGEERKQMDIQPCRSCSSLERIVSNRHP